MSELSDKTLIMLVGPSAIGKSWIMNQAITVNPEFSRVKSFTTRPKRSNDEPDQYFYPSESDRTMQARHGSLITDVTFPATRYHYGTLIDSFRSNYCLLDTMAHSVELYRQLPFYSTKIVSVTAPLEQWRQRFLSRYPSPNYDAEKRIEEAKSSIEWSLGQTDDHSWIVNHDDRLADSAKQLVLIATNQSTGDKTGESLARNMLEGLQKGVWQ